MAANLPSSFPVTPATNILQYAGFRPAFFMPHRRSIGGIVAQVTIDEQASDDVQITEHPVEQGAPIADHAFKRPATVTIRAGWSRQYAWDLSAESGVYGLLLSWQAALLPFDVITGKRNYSNMLIERLQVTTDNHSEFALMATITCRQVILVSTATTSTSAASQSDSAHKDPESTGNSTKVGNKSPSEVGGTYLGTTNEVNVEQLGSSAPSGGGGAPGTVETMDTPAAQTVEGAMVVNQAAPPNDPPVPPVGASDLPAVA
jgi:Dit-like tail protein